MELIELLIIAIAITALSKIVYLVVMSCNKKNKESMPCGMYDKWVLEHECNDIGVFDTMCMELNKIDSTSL